jgi:hypothetical protein
MVCCQKLAVFRKERHLRPKWITFQNWLTFSKVSHFSEGKSKPFSKVYVWKWEIFTQQLWDLNTLRE